MHWPGRVGFPPDYELWYEDGTIILIAHDVEFRVYRGPLAKHSPLFRDMLSIPQPVEPHLLYQGQGQSPECPLIHLSDSPEDLRHILRYQIDKLVDEGLYHLRRAYPTALPYRPAGVVGQCAIAVVNLARLTETGGGKVTQGFTREDGSREFLSREDLGRCFAAKETLGLWNVRTAIEISESVSVDYQYHFDDEMCHHMDVCKEWIQRWRRKFKRGGAGKVEAYRSPNLCSNCLYHAGERIYKERQRLRLRRIIRHPGTRRSEDACIFLSMKDFASAIA
ncbi:hypothetical protein BD310DRAFT_962923 [Dichomitus squalens]|uniref:BTB domain-containing protein n=1 Tax=Dichomitus squalens TaxID=114155 RepID=A0A4Q9PFI9_9APHY|nr:hypothetical protein BD310DRAFT_962923 [Dichomitus squalens]